MNSTQSPLSLFYRWLAAVLLSLSIGGFLQLLHTLPLLNLFSFIAVTIFLIGLLALSLTLFQFLRWKYSICLTLFLSLSGGFYYFHAISSAMVPVKLSLFMGWTVMGLIILSSFFILTADTKND